MALRFLPGVYYLAVQGGRRLVKSTEVPAKENFLGLVYPLVPLGLMIWVAFSIPLLMVNGSYIMMTLSDPFGWGWDLFGTAHIAWTPVLPHWTPFIQVFLLLIGLYYALKTGYGSATKLFGSGTSAVKAFAPVALLLSGFVACFLWLYVG